MRGLLHASVAVLLWALLPTAARGQAAAPNCDASLWKHVYKPQRLAVKNACITVRGTIVDATATEKHRRKDGLRHEGDGDTHGWLKLDNSGANRAQENLLDAGNRSDEGGNLVFEVVCQYRVTQKDAIEACRGYKSAIVIPVVGSHVCITGSYVQDQEHAKWMEIHPVSKIEACT